MKRVKYRRLVETLEQEYKGKSKALRASSSRMMICAYVYLVFVLVVAISVVLTSVFMIIKFPGAASLKIGLCLIIFFGPLCYSILRGIFVKLSPPEGTELTKGNAPKLFDMLDSIVEKECCCSSTASTRSFRLGSQLLNYWFAVNATFDGG